MKALVKLGLTALMAAAVTTGVAGEANPEKAKKKKPALVDIELIGTLKKAAPPKVEAADAAKVAGKKKKRVPSPYSIDLEDGTTVKISKRCLKGLGKVNVDDFVDKKVTMKGTGTTRKVKDKTTYRYVKVSSIVAAGATPATE
jgi:predicted transcriptional regulator